MLSVKENRKDTIKYRYEVSFSNLMNQKFQPINVFS